MSQNINEQIPDIQRFEELIPFYITGQIDDPDRAFVESFLLEHPEAEESIRCASIMRKAVRDTGKNRDPEQAFNRLMGKWQPEGSPGLICRFRDWLGRVMAHPALATAMVIILLQVLAGALYLSLNGSGTDGVTVADVRAQKPHARLVIKDGADAAPLLEVVHKFEARIVGSSKTASASGAYEVFIIIEEKMHLQELFKELSRQNLIEKAELVE